MKKKEIYDLEETLEELEMSLSEFQKLSADLIETTLVRVYPHPKEPGKPQEESPKNKIYYSGESVRKLKAILEAKTK